MGLATRKCVPCENGNLHPLSESAAYTLRNQVGGLAGQASSHLAMHFDGRSISFTVKITTLCCLLLNLKPVGLFLQ